MLSQVEIAYNRIVKFIRETPVICSEFLSSQLGANIYFKIDALQVTNSFKIRGVLNHLLDLQEKCQLPSSVVTYSTGNHGMALAHVAQLLNIKSRVYLPQNVTAVKKRNVELYGTEVIYTDNRQMAEDFARYDSINSGLYYLSPSHDNSTIYGVGTMCYEALMQLNKINVVPDAIFVSCGGGSLVSGTYLAKELLNPTAQLVCCEPLKANDAFLSLQRGVVYRFHDTPDTIADGLCALSVSQLAFEYIRKVDHFFLVDEQQIAYWTVWLIHVLKILCEPSCAMNMSAVIDWLVRDKIKTYKKNILVLITGGNVDYELYCALLGEGFLSIAPSTILKSR